ncbi:MAG: helix-turn-helix transcriptional regulator [Oscillospiraceae bacterium]|nr:helix-turn-helix transcriptional regulator [Oscillospiraceae bacterium]
MTTVVPMIDMTATGANIRSLIHSKGLRVTDVQHICGFNTPQAIFKWMRGDALPSIDNLVILAHVLEVTVDEILVLR